MNKQDLQSVKNIVSFHAADGKPMSYIIWRVQAAYPEMTALEIKKIANKKK